MELKELNIEQLKLLLLSFVRDEYDQDAPIVLTEIINRTKIDR